jgi:hypothetical protein
MDYKSFSALMRFLFQHLFPKWNNTSISLTTGWIEHSSSHFQWHFQTTPHRTVSWWCAPTTRIQGVGPLSQANPCHREQEILPTYAKCAKHRRREVREFRNAKPTCLTQLWYFLKYHALEYTIRWDSITQMLPSRTVV